MATTFKELKRKALMGFKDVHGPDILMMEEAINQACHAIAEVQNFEELIVLDTTNAFTVDGTKRYHVTTNLLLTRPKDILSIVLHDDFNSRKLRYFDTQRLDERVPYPEGYAEGKPEIYTQQGDYLEFIPVPDAAYPLYIRYAQWPVVLTADTDTCSYSKIDSSIIALARDLFLALRGGLPLDTVSKARAYLDIAVDDDRSRPDSLPVAQGFTTRAGWNYKGEYWNNPWVRRVGGN